jgi:hypothetical protein
VETTRHDKFLKTSSLYRINKKFKVEEQFIYQNLTIDTQSRKDGLNRLFEWFSKVHFGNYD